MADTGKLAAEGYGAGAIKYALLDGFVPNPSGSSLIACLTTMGFGIASAHKLSLHGFDANPGSGGSGAYCIFGGSIATGTANGGWL